MRSRTCFTKNGATLEIFARTVKNRLFPSISSFYSLTRSHHTSSCEQAFTGRSGHKTSLLLPGQENASHQRHDVIRTHLHLLPLDLHSPPPPPPSEPASRAWWPPRGFEAAPSPQTAAGHESGRARTRLRVLA